MLEERTRYQLKKIRDAKQANKKFNTHSVKEFLKEQEQFLAHMNHELVEDDLVIKGEIDDSHLFSEFNDHKSKKRKSDA